MKVNVLYGGVVLNRHEYDEKTLEKDGYLVLTDGDIIEVEDDETGELYEGTITLYPNNDDIFMFDVWEKGRIVHEEEVSLFRYLLQLKECGALDAYPRVKF